MTVPSLVSQGLTKSNEPSFFSGRFEVISVIEGTACPRIVFDVGDYIVRAIEWTEYEGGDCEDIAPGTKVAVSGNQQANSIVALRIEIEDAPTPAQILDATADVTGIAAGTACPALQFSFGDYFVRVDAETVYDGGRCGDIAITSRLHVKGAVIAENVVRATRITFVR